MKYLPQMKIPATYMRGGTSKGVFFLREQLPEEAREPGFLRDQLLLRVMGSPDPYEKQIDGLGGASSSTSKVVIIAKSQKPDHDVDYLFGQVSIGSALIDWSGNCGNLSAAVGPFAIRNRLLDAARIPEDGFAMVRIWQANIGKTIIAHVPVADGKVQETGDFELDGVTFPAAEIALEFLDPAEEGGKDALFPTGNTVDVLEVPRIGAIKATMINAGIPTVFVEAKALGYTGKELQSDINSDASALARIEAIREYGALRMGLVPTIEAAAARQHIPKIAYVAGPGSFVTSSGKSVDAADVDLLVRAFSMGKLHHAMMGTASVAVATAAAIQGTLVNIAAGGGEHEIVKFGHPSGSLRVGAVAERKDGMWRVKKATMSRSARVLMEGCVWVPSDK